MYITIININNLRLKLNMLILYYQYKNSLFLPNEYDFTYNYS